MAFSVSQMLYRLFGNRVSMVDNPAPATIQPRPDRPSGQLVWLHIPDASDHPIASSLLSSIADEHPDCWFLLTTEGQPLASPPDQAIFQYLTSDRPAEAREFMAHWKPDLAIWLSDHLLPTLIHEAETQNVPLLLFDAGAAFETTKSTWYLPRLTRRTLRKFDALLCSDEATTLALISAGARRESVRTTGAMELTVSPPPCIDSEWTTLANLVATRPVWLATQIEPNTLESILTAHMQATRRSHRLLLIIVPTNPDETPEFKKILDARNLLYSIRSMGEEPDKEVQVYLADTEDEIGLWYRLAPVCYLGQSLEKHSKTEPNPLEAASLGSVVLHSPGPTQHDVAYRRLGRAGASRELAHLGELAHALETVLAPDRAAVMAHAAWQITSAGAEAMDAALAVVSEYLDKKPEPNP